MSQRETKSGLFSYLLALTGLFVLMEVSYLCTSNVLTFEQYHTVTKALHVPPMVMSGLFFFLLAQGLVHLGYTLFIWLNARLVGMALSLSWHQTQLFGMGLWVLGIITVLLANQYYFPHAVFSKLLSGFVPLLVTKGLYLLCVFLLTTIALIALKGLYQLTRRYLSPAVIAVWVSSVIPLALYTQIPTIIPFNVATSAKPNIIIIGIDGLRPDFLGYFGANKHRTPHIDAFLNQSAVYAEAMTPIARTFPSWSSILTGQYPKRSHIRYNLMDQTQLNLSGTLPARLQEQGYETLFAMDETRFSNIDTNFGFDHIITPPIGFNDFFLGSLNDFPLSNLLINTSLGHLLFPYSYANRPVYATYNPDSFLTLLKPVLTATHRKPVFMAVHFCLPHFPYFWGEYRMQNARALRHYQAAIKRSDEQVGAFLQMLQQNHFLDHAIVVLLSDHGEAIELHGDRVTDPHLLVTKDKSIRQFYPPSLDKEEVDQSAGHGTDVLGITQYHSLLAFRSYGVYPVRSEPHTIPGIVSLLDIKPTLLAWLSVPYREESGDSLLESVAGKRMSAVRPHTDFFIESDYSPESVRTVHPEMRKVVLENLNMFVVDPQTGRLIVKPSMAKMILNSKQYADFYDNWVLALYPQTNKEMVPVLVNLETGQWTYHLDSPFAQQSPAQHMLLALRQFYGSDITHITH